LTAKKKRWFGLTKKCHEFNSDEQSAKQSVRSGMEKAMRCERSERAWPSSGTHDTLKNRPMLWAKRNGGAPDDEEERTKWSGDEHYGPSTTPVNLRGSPRGEGRSPGERNEMKMMMRCAVYKLKGNSLRDDRANW